jgi:hypothetical protein
MVRDNGDGDHDELDADTLAYDPAFTARFQSRGFTAVRAGNVVRSIQ